ncbi:MAG: hypothetical protein IKB07_09635 [Lachnospiraceae bacterium]|nr:hypothetical protein [Lachnospiraceae bacterium]
MAAGVYETTKKDGTPSFRASFTHKGKHISLGSFPTKEQAHRAYLTAELLLRSPEGSLLSLEDYAATGKSISYEKWVILLNLRDNGIYFKTPIYLYRRHFVYHYNEETHLKFDVDDLFYFSNHKIMKRGGHLFVADYGMQVTLPSRYGIKNYAVEGRDYRFANGDPTDFRYGNLEIINRYAGVTAETKKGNTCYLSKIHINGDYIIGRYSTEAEAALAYNKAADYLNKHGFDKNYPRNYVDGLSEEETDAIYRTIVLPPKLRHAVRS